MSKTSKNKWKIEKQTKNKFFKKKQANLQQITGFGRLGIGLDDLKQAPVSILAETFTNRSF